MFAYLGRLLRENLGLKLFSLLVAILLWAWVTVRVNPPLQRDVEVRVMPRNVPAELTALSVTPETSTLTLRGLKRLMDGVSPKQIVLTCELGGRGIGEHVVPLTPERVPPGIVVLGQREATARVVLDRIETERRPVSVRFRGHPEAGYQLGKPEANPGEVALRGAATRLAQVRQVVAEWDVTGLAATSEFEAELRALDEKGNPVSGVSLDPGSVALAVGVTRVLSKTVPIVPELGPADGGFAVTEARSDPPTVTITGNGEALSKTESVHSEQVSLAGVRGSKSFDLKLRYPEGITPVGPGAATVRVTVGKRPVVAPEGGTVSPGAGTPATPGSGSPGTPGGGQGSPPATDQGTAGDAPGGAGATAPGDAKPDSYRRPAGVKPPG